MDDSSRLVAGTSDSRRSLVGRPGYRVEVSEVREVYGDGYFDEDFPTPKVT